MAERSRRPWLLALAGLLVATKAVAVLVDPASFSPRILPNLLTAIVVVLLVRAGLRAPRRRLPGRLLGGLCVLMIAYVATIARVDAGLRARTYEGVFDDPHKVWAARGFVVEGPLITPDGTQNSIESVSRCFERGARGVEVDVRFDPPTGRFVVSHDLPYNRKNGEILPMRALFDAVGDGGIFWLDWKSQRDLSEEELAAALDEIEELAAPGDRRSRIYVEGEAPLPILQARRRGLLTILDARPRPDSSPLAPWMGDLYKALYYFGGHTVMSMNSGDADDPIYGAEMRRILRDVPVFVYHVPTDDAFLDELLAEPQVRAILMNDHSLDRYGRVASQS